MEENKRNIIIRTKPKWQIVLIAGLVAFVLGIGGAYFLNLQLGVNESGEIEAQYQSQVDGLNRTIMNLKNKLDEMEDGMMEEEGDTVWKSYNNPVLGFTLQYPENWNIEENNGAIYFSSKNPWPEEGSRALVVSRENRSIEGYIEDYNNSDVLEGGERLSLIIEQKDFDIDNNEATWLVGTTALGINNNIIFASYDGRNYTISFDDQYDVHMDILASFKFSDPIDTSNWQTYEDPEGNFSVKYPQDWIVGDPDGNTGYIKIYSPDALDPDRQTAAPILHFSQATSDDIFKNPELIEVINYTQENGVKVVQGKKEGVPHLQVTGFEVPEGGSYVGVSRPYTAQYSDIMDTILSTFEFTE